MALGPPVGLKFVLFPESCAISKFFLEMKLQFEQFCPIRHDFSLFVFIPADGSRTTLTFIFKTFLYLTNFFN